jgi:hypothetical protein
MSVPKEIWQCIFAFCAHNCCTDRDFSTLRAIDLVCKEWNAWNKISGWRQSWINFGVPSHWVSLLKNEELLLWLDQLKRIHKMNRQIPNRTHRDMLSKIFRHFQEEPFVADLVYFFISWSFYEFRPFNGPAEADINLYNFFTDNVDAVLENPKSFFYFGDPVLGGGDTKWWMYLCVKGPGLKCAPAYPLWQARKSWPHSAEDELTKEKNKRIFGPGSVFVFSLWNHCGSSDYPPTLVPPEWKEVDGVFALYDEETCDEWIKSCVETPHETYSADSWPCAWTLSDFLQEILLRQEL